MSKKTIVLCTAICIFINCYCFAQETGIIVNGTIKEINGILIGDTINTLSILIKEKPGIEYYITTYTAKKYGLLKTAKINMSNFDKQNLSRWKGNQIILTVDNDGTEKKPFYSITSLKLIKD